MRISLTIEAEPAEVARINKMLEIATALEPDKGPEQLATFIEPESVAPPPLFEEPVAEPVHAANEEGNGATPPKRRGRPPKMPVEKPAIYTAEVVSDHRYAPQAEESEPKLDLADDAKVVKIVTDFLADNKHLAAAVLSLLREYHAEKVSSVPVIQRAEFLSRMDGLSVLQ